MACAGACAPTPPTQSAHRSWGLRKPQDSTHGRRGTVRNQLCMSVSKHKLTNYASALSPWSAHRGDHGCGDAGEGCLARLLETGLDDDLLASGAAGRQRAPPRQTRGGSGRSRCVLSQANPVEMRTRGRGRPTGPSLPAWASTPESSLPWAPAWSASRSYCSSQIHAGSYQLLSGEIKPCDCLALKPLLRDRPCRRHSATH